jgi:dihydroorotate dehydrogenase
MLFFTARKQTFEFLNLCKHLIFSFASVYKRILKPFFFLFDPEEVHYFVFDFIKIAYTLPFIKSLVKWWYTVKNASLEKTIMGLQFSNPVGIAAGFDKDARLYKELESFGFGFVEIGTVTPVEQSGNPKPRLFRLPTDEAVVNRMGFNNEGALAAAQRLSGRKPGLIVGGNIGKNKNTPNENAADDYVKCVHILHRFVDYFAINVSSPNTPGLRELQEKEPLRIILMAVKNELDKFQIKKPVCLKIAPDLTNSQLDEIVELVLQCEIDGIIATNTTISRENLKSPEMLIGEIGNGGLSGQPLKNRSTEVIKYLAEAGKGRFAIIGVGGIFTPDDALEKLKAGADLVQVYTGFIYEGPGIAKKINKHLAQFPPLPQIPNPSFLA